MVFNIYSTSKAVYFHWWLSYLSDHAMLFFYSERTWNVDTLFDISFTFITTLLFRYCCLFITST